MKSNPKVSVITTTYNDLDNLKRIITLVKQQDYENIEHIIVDGGSVDGTVEYLKLAEKESVGKIKWMSEKDQGIFDAINKGIKLSEGDIIGCCFDEFTKKTVISQMVHIIEKEKTDGVHADLLYMDGERVVRTWKQGQGNIRFGWMPGHPTLYLKKEVYEKFGVYKPYYKVSADYEYMVRILKDKQVRLSYIPEILIKMSHGGTSTNGLKAYLNSLKEGHMALKENKIKFAWFTDCCRTFKVLLQFVR
ncbi:glycosyl transferase family 2 [Lachnotalea glycerini]|uniref:Glycosyl transferase family 2 n=1 Tax=Lachnotalea glycerini TaxID=1763509 RepID=A0A318ES22_9FIRM|nr:glycosyltransferase family 2 protein [Lachnotalea glycerini]PXV90154.1 glycosyl transferase family 2 [Lachnotalea glycerini]